MHINFFSKRNLALSQSLCSSEQQQQSEKRGQGQKKTGFLKSRQMTELWISNNRKCIWFSPQLKKKKKSKINWEVQTWKREILVIESKYKKVPGRSNTFSQLQKEWQPLAHVWTSVKWGRKTLHWSVDKLCDCFLLVLQGSTGIHFSTMLSLPRVSAATRYLYFMIALSRALLEFRTGALHH